MKRLVLILSVFALLGFLAGCEKPAAVVNGTKITKDEYRKAVDQRIYVMSSSGMPVDRKAVEKEVLDSLITEKLVIDEAKKRNITVLPAEIEGEYARIVSFKGKDVLDRDLKATKTTDAEFKESIKTTILLHKLVTASMQPVTEQEVEDIYAKTRGKQIKPDSVYMRFIQVASKEEGEGILKELKGSKQDFDRVADKLDKEKKAVVSRYNWVPTGFFSPEMKTAVRNLREGAYGGPYKGMEGYYIVRVKEKSPERAMGAEEAKKEIRKELEVRRRQETVQALLGELRGKSRTTVNK